MDIKIFQMDEKDLKILKDILIKDFDEFWSFNTLKEELECTNSYYIVAKENLINKSIELGASTITLEVDENNSPALHLYEKYNFKKVGLRKKYYNGINNAVIMTKDLKNF